MTATFSINPNWVILGNFDKTPYESTPQEVIDKMSAAEREEFEHEKQEFFARSRLHGLDNSVWPFAIGGSDAGAVYGVSPWSTALDLYFDKKGIPAYKPREMNPEILEIGHDMEPIVRKWFNEATGFDARPFPYQIRNKKWPHLVANIDGIIQTPEGIGVYEGKTTSNENYKKIRDWKKGIVPLSYQFQCFFYMAVLELPFTYICCSWGYGSNNMKYVKIERLPEEIETEFMNTLEKFVLDCEKNIIPSLATVEDRNLVLEAIKRTYTPVANPAKPIELPDKFSVGLDKYIELDAQKKKLEKEINFIKEQMIGIEAAIAEHMAENTHAEYKSGRNKFTITFEGKTRTKVDKDLLKLKNPVLFEEVNITYQTARSMSIKKS